MKEPNIDAMFDEIQKCGEPCKNIETWTELGIGEHIVSG